MNLKKNYFDENVSRVRERVKNVLVVPRPEGEFSSAGPEREAVSSRGCGCGCEQSWPGSNNKSGHCQTAECAVCRLQCAVCCVQCAVCSVQREVCRVQIAVCSV